MLLRQLPVWYPSPRSAPHRPCETAASPSPRGCRPTGPPASFWRNHRMKTSGLPCPATMDCDVVLTPADDNTLKLLLDAAALRDAHELAVHRSTHRLIH